MSAAEPANPPHALNSSPGAAVIDITKHRRGGVLQAAQERWNPMSTPPDPGRPNQPGERSPLEGIADYAEEWFNAIERSLTDKETALVYARTLELVEHVLKGAVAQDMITEEKRAQLDQLFEPLRQAPRLI